MMKTLLLVMSIVSIVTAIQPTRLRVEYEESPFGIDESNPRFSWSYSNVTRMDRQVSYQIVVINVAERRPVGDTGKVVSSDNGQIIVSELDLESHSIYEWQLTIWNSTHETTAVSSFRTAIMPSDTNQWSSSNWLRGITPQHYQFRFPFTVPQGPLALATCYIASPNYYKAYINGTLIGDHELGSFTTFQKRTYYDSWDCGKLLSPGDDTVVAVEIGNGFYSHPSVNVGPPMFKLFIRLDYGGNVVQITSNANWTHHTGPVTSSDLFMGEDYDARMETPGWTTTDFVPHEWEPVVLAGQEATRVGKLVSSAVMPKVKVTEMYPMKDITLLSNLSAVVMNFGQNLAGFAEIIIPPNTNVGHNLTITFSEFVHENGTVAVQWPTKAAAICKYTMKGTGQPEIWRPKFVYFGFQYIQISNLPKNLKFDTNSGKSYFVHTDFKTDRSSLKFGPSSTGGGDTTMKLDTNADLLNTIQHMTRYASLSNWVSIPTDCPTREKRGWLGDAGLTFETVLYNFDVAAAYTKFVTDIEDVQQFVNKSGALPECVPYYNHGAGPPGDPAWTMGYVIIVYQMFQYFGDTQIVHSQYNGMRDMITYWEQHLWDPTQQIVPLGFSIHGDWDSDDFTHGQGLCPHRSSLINTFEFGILCEYFSIMATAVGNTSDATHFSKLSTLAKSGINRFYNATAGGYYESEDSFLTDTSIALAWLTAESTHAEESIASLVDNIKNWGSHMPVGIVGQKYINSVLCDFGHCDLALESNLLRTYPSFGYWAMNGATTLWEHWASSRYSSGTCGPNHPGTKNHIMFGSQGSWYYSYLAGIRMANWKVDRAWNSFIVHPFVNITNHGINSINAVVDTVRGPIKTDLYLSSSGDGDSIFERISIEVPVGSLATVYFDRPAVFDRPYPISQWVIKDLDTSVEVFKNGTFHQSKGVTSARILSPDTVILTLQSGSYRLQLSAA
eukprot:TRINITY_DN12460_c0_g1_i3.p1 TRINITY_DN12460_c0_g1~~TRINITY_DN12460_c0_g1_i3.p1  ORF type:complete len:953 (+),score=118.90 TRINITY_DN12460_c0_g1_i3:45-2903(+)